MEGPFVFCGAIEEMISSLQGIRDSVPEELRDEIEVEIETTGGYEGSCTTSFVASYTRPATGKEITECKITEQNYAKAEKERKAAMFFKLKEELGL